MEFKFKKHVTIVCSLNIGDTVRTDKWGPNLDGRDWIIQDMKLGVCESGVMVKISGCDSYIDSSWLIKQEQLF